MREHLSSEQIEHGFRRRERATSVHEVDVEITVGREAGRLIQIRRKELSYRFGDLHPRLSYLELSDDEARWLITEITRALDAPTATAGAEP